MPARRAADALRDFRAAFAHDQAGRRDRAEALYRRVLQKDPDNAEALHLLGVIAHERGRHSRAIQLIERALASLPEFPAAHVNLGNALRATGRLEEAAESYRRAIGLKPDYARGHCNLAAIENEQGAFEAGLASADRAIALAPDLAQAHINRADALMGQSRFAEAAASFRCALDLLPERGEVWHGLGNALLASGQIEESLSCFRRAFAIDPDLAEAHLALAFNGQRTADGAQLERLAELWANTDRPPSSRIAAGFALGAYLDRAEKHDEAFSYFAEANTLHRQLRADAGERFDDEVLQREIGGLIERCSPALFSAARGWGNPSDLPVFVVGMPHSGADFVEQIAGNHPLVFGAGERKDISRIVEAVLARNRNKPTNEWDMNSARQLADEHIAKLRTLGGGAARVVDRTTENIFHLGIITLLFPAARVIFCRRDPRDICLSCYFHRFTEGAFYSYALSDCARQFLEIERLAMHWQRSLPLSMLTIDYEALVADPNREGRRVIEFLGLDWRPVRREFRRIEGSICAGRGSRLDEPIGSRSVGRWRRYEKHLGPLLKVLAQSGRPA
jgi:tetratricopeptide (TPR) repeat protein